MDRGLVRSTRQLMMLTLLGGLTALGACDETVGPTTQPLDVMCNLDTNLLFASLAPNAIPAVNAPAMVDPDDVAVDYLLDTDKVLGVVMNGEARAYPHNVLWHHEIVNDDIGGTPVSVTFCPLTGSGLAFSPVVGAQTLDLGVSGLLFANNLVMYDRTSGDVYGPQLTVNGVCDSFSGTSLDLLPVQEMSWGRWKELHPDTRVVSGSLGFARNYRAYPYGTYDDINNTDLLQSMAVDDTRPIKERVLAIRDGAGGRGYPYGDLRDMGDVVAINDDVGGVPTVVFFESRLGNAALAFDRRVGGQTLTFEAQPGGSWVDLETNSTWQLDGTATGGPLAGEVLRTREDAYTVFWFAWRHFQPNGEVYEAP